MHSSPKFIRSTCYFLVEGNNFREQFSFRVIFVGESVLWAIMLWGNCPGSNYPGGNFPRGQLSGSNHPGGNYPGGNYPRGQLS